MKEIVLPFMIYKYKSNTKNNRGKASDCMEADLSAGIRLWPSIYVPTQERGKHSAWMLQPGNHLSAILLPAILLFRIYMLWGSIMNQSITIHILSNQSFTCMKYMGSFHMTCTNGVYSLQARAGIGEKWLGSKQIMYTHHIRVNKAAVYLFNISKCKLTQAKEPWHSIWVGSNGWETTPTFH